MLSQLIVHCNAQTGQICFPPLFKTNELDDVKCFGHASPCIAERLTRPYFQTTMSLHLSLLYCVLPLGCLHTDLRQPTCRHGDWPEQKGLSLLSNNTSRLAAVFVLAC